MKRTPPVSETPRPSESEPPAAELELPTADDEPERAGRGTGQAWYGGPLIATYALTPAVVAVSVSADAIGLGIAAVFSSPIVHWVNGKGGKGALALFMQPVFAGVGALIGSSGCDSSSCDGPIIAGAVVGYAVWAAIDVGLQAYKEAPPRKAIVVGVAPFRTREATGVEVGGVW